MMVELAQWQAGRLGEHLRSNRYLDWRVWRVWRVWRAWRVWCVFGDSEDIGR